MTKKTWKAAAAAILAVAAACAPITGGAATIQTTVSPTAIKISYNPMEAISLFAEGARLAVADIPLDSAFRYATLKAGSQAFTIAERGPERVVAFDLNGLAPGTHSIAIAFSDSPDGVWKPYITELLLSWNGRSAALAGFGMLEFNRQKRASTRTDAEALKVYLQQSVDPSITRLAEALTDGVKGEYGKALAIHDWICANIYYDYDAFESGRKSVTVLGSDDFYGKYTKASSYWALEALSSRTGVCQGYASLNAALLREAGIPAMVVSGYALGVESNLWPSDITHSEYSNHAWNEAFVGGRWIIIDPTWDSENAFRKGLRTNSGGRKYYRYFDASIEAFSLNHCYSKGIMIGELKPKEVASATLKAPARVRATSIGPDAISLSWAVVDGADGYEIFRSESPAGPFKRKAYTTTNTRTEMTNTGLDENAEYYYRIRSYALDGEIKHCSPFARAVSATTEAERMASGE
jgi:hypothetical protein